MMVASQWKISSSDRGPAEHEVGGSFCKSCLNCYAVRKIIIIIINHALMLFRGQRLRFKCDGPTKSPMLCPPVERLSLEKEPTTNGRKKRSEKKKRKKCLLSARREIKRPRARRRDRQILSTPGKKLGRMISVLETSVKTYHELFGDSFRRHFNVFLSLLFFSRLE